jgi:hypothetical protein
MEFAFEGTRLRADAGPQPSVFTGALVEGIRSGEADRDQDGFVSLSELYDFVYQRVRAATPNQTPCKWEFDMQGDLHLARNPHRRVQPGALPPDLQALVSSTTTAARLGAVAELVYLAGGSDLSLAAAAQAALLELCRDDSQRVSAAAQDGVVRGAPSLPESVIDLGTGQVRGPPLTVGLPVQGSPLALTSEILSTGSPLHAELESGVLRVSAPTDRAGPIDARITLSGPAGDTTVEVTGSVAAAPGPREQPPEELPEPPETPAPVPGAGTVAPDRETPDGETPDGETPDGDRRRWWIAAGAVAVIAAAIALVVALRPDGTTGTPGDPTGTTATQAVQQQVTVDGTRPFTETGMQLSEGQRVTVTANGQVFHRPGASTGPEGTTEQGLRSPLSTANHNALIARIGPNGPPFLIGPSADFTVWTSGSFQLGINDGGLENNSGSYNAQVVVQPAQ